MARVGSVSVEKAELVAVSHSAREVSALAFRAVIYVDSSELIPSADRSREVLGQETDLGAYAERLARVSMAAPKARPAR